jgi:hypothetical protein
LSQQQQTKIKLPVSARVSVSKHVHESLVLGKKTNKKVKKNMANFFAPHHGITLLFSLPLT